jgi:putative transposase
VSRQAREKSQTGIYHIMLRGINQQQIFEDEEDNIKLLEVLKECKAVSEYKIYAYCFMGNHFHLLLKVGKEDLELIFKRIGARFVYWYNWKYKRKGHLFQDRFKSEPVKDDSYFFTVLRYIHQNPVKVGFTKTVEKYSYSSYNEYIKPKKNQLTDVDFALGIMDIEQFIKFNNEDNDDKCLENDEKNFRLTDDEARKIIYKVSKCKNVTQFQELDVKKRNTYIKKLKENSLSIRQISRLTGVSKGVVEKLHKIF